LSGKQFGTRVGFVVPTDAPLVLVVADELEASPAADALQVVAYDRVVGYCTLQDWRAAGNQVADIASISPQSLFHRLSASNPTLVLDVREPNEWREGHIEGAFFIPYRELPARIADVPTGAPVAVVCDAGQRSVIAASLLQRSELRNVMNVDSGMSGWRRAGLPILAERAESADLHAAPVA
jgi:hydroxyacylglutathione hydrolase